MTVGILAFGKWYRYWAYNLAVSIKYHSDCKVHLICDQYDGGWPFDEITYLDKQDYITETRKGKQYFPCLAKLSLNKYINEPTLILDADSLVLKDLSDLDFTGFYHSEVQAYGKKGEDFRQMLWATTDQAFEHFGLPDTAEIPALNTSFQYLAPCKELDELYETARDMLLNNPFDTRKSEQKWGKGDAGGGNHPDELYMDMALAKLGIKADYPALLHFPFKNSDFRKKFGRMALKTKKQVLENGFYGLSFAGDGNNIAIAGKEIYEGEMKRYMNHFGIGHVYQIHNLLTRKFIRLQ